MKTYELNTWIRIAGKEDEDAFEGKIVKINESKKGSISYTVENLTNEKKVVKADSDAIRLIQVQLINRSHISATISKAKISADDVRFIRKYWGRISRKDMAALFDISTAFAYKTATRRTMFSIPDGDPTDELVKSLGYDHFIIPAEKETESAEA